MYNGVNIITKCNLNVQAVTETYIGPDNYATKIYNYYYIGSAIYSS